MRKCYYFVQMHFFEQIIICENVITKKLLDQKSK